jgi:fibronectin-binding autotransporter adhesin
MIIHPFTRSLSSRMRFYAFSPLAFMVLSALDGGGGRSLMAQNLVTNGDFSANAASFIDNNGYFGGNNPVAVPNWTTTGSGVNGTLTPSGDPFAPATNVPSFLFMQSPRTASQAIATVAATDYLFSFDAAARNLNTAGVSVFANNLNPASLSLEAGYGWLPNNAFQRYAFGFTATGPQTIQFNSSGTGDHTTNITNVSVTASAGSVWQITDGTRFFTETSGTHNYGFSLVGNNQQIYHRPGTATYTGNITTDGSAGALTFVGREDEGVSNLIFSGSTMTLGAKSFAVTGTTVDSEAQSGNSKVTLTNSIVTTDSNVDVGRGTLEITGTTSLTIGGQLRSGVGGDWGRFIMGAGNVRHGDWWREHARQRSCRFGPLSQWRHLDHASITGNAFGGQTNVQFNGTTVVASGNNADFLDVRLSGNATPYSAAAQLGNNGGIFNTNGFAITINNALANMAGNNGNLEKQGSGTLTLSAINTYTGVTQVNGGILALAGGSAIPDAGAVVLGNVSGATLQLNANETIGSLAGGGTTGGNVNIQSNTLTTGGANTSTSFAGALQGTGTLVKRGTGTFSLTGTNSNFSGTVILEAGIVNVASLSNYGVNGSLGNRASDSAANVGLLFRGGTLQYTGSTAQSTNRGIRISTTGGATIDASGSVGGATLSFIAASSPDFFENGGNRSLTLTGSNTGGNTFAMQIAQAGGTTSLTKSGVGQWILSGNNTYSGGTNISAGTLRTSHASALGTGPVSIASGANLLLWWNANTSQVANNITLNGLGGPSPGGDKAAIYADGGGPGGHGEYTLAGSLTLSATSNLGGNSDNNLRVSGQITGPGGLTKGGGRTDENNTLVLANSANNYNGNTSITKGTLQLAASEVIPHGPGAGTVSVASGTTLDLGGYSETINNLSGGGTITTTASISSPSFFTNDSGTDISTGKTYTHKLDFNAGSTFATVNGVAFDNGGSWTLSGATGATGNGATGATGGISTLLEDFNFNGNPATLTLNGLTPGQTYQARLYQRFWGGDRTQRFTLDPDGAGPISARLVYNEDTSTTPSYLTFRYTANSSGTATITTNQVGAGSYHWYGATNEVVAAPVLTVGDSNDSTFTGVITGNLGLVKQGDGMLTLTNTNTYTGATTVTAGELRIDGALANTSGVSVSGTGVLSGTGSISTSSLVFGPGSVLAPGDSPGVISLATNLTLNAGSTFLVDVLNPTSDQVVLTGTMTVNGATLETVWGGDSDDIFRGGVPTPGQMVWLVLNDGIADPIGGSGFVNDGGAVNSGLAGLFGFGSQPHLVSGGGVSFALFYDAEYNPGNPLLSTLSGGNDLLLIAIPEPSRSLLLGLVLIPVVLRRVRRR